MSLKIFFICTGNTCRSPMAEGFLKHQLAPHRRPSYTVLSAGIHALDGMPVAGNSVKVMLEKGIDISGHFSRYLRPSDVQEADLILTMTRNQKEYLVSLEPLERSKFFQLSEYAVKNAGVDIPDPVGQDLDTYRSCRDLIDKYITILADKINGP
jgi:protein-tyrosine-phosphatase